MAKDPEAAFFKRLEGLQPCEVSALKAGTHIFAVYGLSLFFWVPLFKYYMVFVEEKLRLCTSTLNCTGDNFFKTASYTIEALCTRSYEDTTHSLKDIEAQILRKRVELRQFETEYRQVMTPYFIVVV